MNVDVSRRRALTLHGIVRFPQDPSLNPKLETLSLSLKPQRSKAFFCKACRWHKKQLAGAPGAGSHRHRLPLSRKPL